MLCDEKGEGLALQRSTRTLPEPRRGRLLGASLAVAESPEVLLGVGSILNPALDWAPEGVVGGIVLTVSLLLDATGVALVLVRNCALSVRVRHTLEKKNCYFLEGVRG